VLNTDMNVRILQAQCLLHLAVCKFAIDQVSLGKKNSSESPVSPCGRRSGQTDGPPNRTFALRDILGMPPKIFKDQKVSGSHSFTVTTRCYNTRIYL